MVLAPRTFQNIPGRFRLPKTVLHPASITPEPTDSPCLPECWKTHAFFIPFKAVGLGLNVLGDLRAFEVIPAGTAPSSIVRFTRPGIGTVRM
jgi:hypothetical protein